MCTKEVVPAGPCVQQAWRQAEGLARRTWAGGASKLASLRKEGSLLTGRSLEVGAGTICRCARGEGEGGREGSCQRGCSLCA